MRKNKSIVFMLIMGMFILAMTSCGKKNTEKDNNVGNDTVQNEEENTGTLGDSVEEKIVNEDGEIFTPSIEEKGIVKSGTGINVKEVTLAGKTYSFPIKMSELLDDGWHFSEKWNFEDAFEPNQKTNLISFYLYYVDGSEIMLKQIFNNTSEIQKIKDCLLTEFQLDGFNRVMAEDFDFVVPGGITKNSTALDVLTAFGNPNENSDFKNGYNLDHQLTYSEHKETELSFTFLFDEDGKLNYVGIKE